MHSTLDTIFDWRYALEQQNLLEQIISDSRWDMAYLGMQIMVEGLADSTVDPEPMAPAELVALLSKLREASAPA